MLKEKPREKRVLFISVPIPSLTGKSIETEDKYIVQVVLVYVSGALDLSVLCP